MVRTAGGGWPEVVIPIGTRARDDPLVQLIASTRQLMIDPHIALTFVDFDEDAPAPDMSPLFMAVAHQPVLSVRGGISDLLNEQGVEAMRALRDWQQATG